MLAIIKGCGNNITSLLMACQRLGYQAVHTADRAVIEQADAVILPGVGHAGAAMNNLQHNGLDRVITGLTVPVLGICLGMQLLFEHLEEGSVDGLGIMPGNVSALSVQASQSLLHMGWNKVQWQQTPVMALSPVDLDAYYYFVHRYAAPVNEYTLASCEYGERFAAVVKRENFVGMQYHPEKSAVAGEQILRWFLEETLK